MICAIMQPTYIPWIGYFDLIDKVDKFVFLDDVQLTKRSWQVRNRIKGKNGEIWLTIPIIKTRSRNELSIKDAMTNDNEKWRKKHLKTIELNYKKSACFDEVYPFLVDMYSRYISLCELNSGIIMEISEKIQITTDFIYSSSLSDISGNKDEKLVHICKAIGANEYLSPQGSAEYINLTSKGGRFIEKNIALYYHSYDHPIYKQLYDGFIPYLGIYDLLFNEGFEKALNIIRKGRCENIHYEEL